MIKLKSGISLWLLLLGGVTLMVGLMWPDTASAQCGSSASSCKNCHEVQGEDPVNNDGTSWHQAHAFGDFCEFCHAGNVQATDKAGAHTGMEAPLDNVQASCGNCHAADLDERAQVYATALGVEVSSGGSGTAAGGGAGSAPTDAAPPPSSDGGSTAPAAISLVVNDPNTVDYVARYNEQVLGIRPINWGNIILGVLIAVLAVGGGFFIIRNEGLLDVKFGETRPLTQEYPADVVELLPAIVGLKPRTRRELHQILENPQKSAQAFDLIELLTQNDEGRQES